MKSNRTPFSAALEYLIRTTKNITQKKLAGEIGLSQSFVSALKDGEREGTEETRRKIAEFFGSTYEDFLSLGNNLLQFDMNKPKKNLTENSSSFSNLFDQTIIETLVSQIYKLEPYEQNRAIENLYKRLQGYNYKFFRDIKNKENLELDQKFDDREVSEPKPASYNGGNVSKIDFEHQNLVSCFKDKEAGLEANKNLIELEKLDTEEFYAIVGRIKGKVKKLKDNPVPSKNGTRGE